MLYTALLVLGVLYAAILALIVMRSIRQSRGGSADEQWHGKRNFGGVATGFTFGATQLSASGIIGAAGLGYAVGATFTIMIIVALIVTYALVFFVVGPRIRRATGKLNSSTIPEFLGQRFASKPIRTISAVLIVVLVLPVMVVQYRAAGLLVETVFNFSYAYSVLIVGLLVAVYSAFGGYKAVVDTDVFQGLIMIFGLVVLAGAVLMEFDGIGNLVSQFGEAAPGLLGISGVLTPLAAIGIFVSFAIALFGQPYIVVRFMTVADRRSVYSTAFVIAMVMQIISIAAVFAAMAGRVRYPELDSADSVIFQVAIDFMNPWLAALLLLALLSALMATVDSALLVVGSSLVKDLMVSRMARQISDRSERVIGRWATLAIGVGCAFLALRPPELITMLMAQVSGVIGILFGIPIVLGLFVRQFSAREVWVSWLSGGASYLVLTALGEPIPAVLGGLVVGLGLAGLSMLFFKREDSEETLASIAVPEEAMTGRTADE